MSYILQALRKSEQERQRGSIPNLQSAQTIPGHSREKPSFWQPLLVGALVINAAAMIYWLHPWREEGAVIQTASTPAPQHATLEPDSKKPSGNPPLSAPPPPQQQASLRKNLTPLNGRSATVRQTSAPEAFPVGKTKKGDEPSSVQKQWLKITPSNPRTQNLAPGIQTTVQAVSSGKPAAASRTSASSQPKPATPAAKDMPEPEVPSIHGMPVNVQKNLPAILISAHIYSEDQETRMAIINDKTLREGQSVAPGLVLEEITRNGVILNFQGHRFHLGKLQSWRRN